MTNDVIHVFGFRGDMKCYQGMTKEQALERYHEYYLSVWPEATIDESAKDFVKTIEPYRGEFSVYDIWE